MYPNKAEVQDLLNALKHENNVKANCVSFDAKPIKEAEVVMNEVMEVSDTFSEIEVEIDLEENTSTEDKPTYQFYLDENDLPSFSGDYMEYMEWKRRWQSLLSPYIENPRLELSLVKENIPERGKKRLFDVQTLPE